MPIFQASVFEHNDLDAVRRIGSGAEPGFIYSRVSNPTVWAFEQDMCAFEKGDVAIASSSGMSAIFSVFAGLLSAGDHVIVAEQLYGATYALIEHMLRRFGISATYVDVTNLDAIEAARTPHTKLCYIESIANPLLQVSDIAGISAWCHQHQVALCVDNTFATPVGIQPLRLGADISLHSATKYIGGHSDVTAGVVVAKAQFEKPLRSATILSGGTLDPHAAWLLLRGLKTLSLRFEKQRQNAAVLAERLLGHSKIEKLYHTKESAVLALSLRGNVNQFLQASSHLPITPSLGGTMTTTAHPASMSHHMIPAHVRARIGVTEQLIRVSVGLEHPDDTWRELSLALSAC